MAWQNGQASIVFETIVSPQIVRQQTVAALATESAGAGAKVRQSTPHAYQDFTERFCGLCERRRRAIAIDNSLSRSASSQLISAKVLPTGECRIFTTGTVTAN